MSPRSKILKKILPLVYASVDDPDPYLNCSDAEPADVGLAAPVVELVVALAVELVVGLVVEPAVGLVLLVVPVVALVVVLVVALADLLVVGLVTACKMEIINVIIYHETPVQNGELSKVIV